MSSAPSRHAGDTPSTSDVKVGKNKTTVKFPCMLCEGDHYYHLCTRMDEDSYILEKIQLPISYCNIPPNPLLVDGMVNPVPSLVTLVDQVVNLVSSLVEPLTKVADPVPSSINPTFHLKSANQVTDPVPSLVIPTLHLKSANMVNPTPPMMSFKVVDLVASSVDLALPLESATQVVDPFPLVDPVLPLENETQVVNLMSSSVDPTLPLESKPDSTNVFLVDTESTVMGGIPPSPTKPPPSNEAILFDWGVLIGPHLPSHIPFNITIQVCGRTVPQTLIDEGSSISIFFFLAWQDLGGLSISIFSFISWKDLGYP
jgi:hypothetical protein